MSIATFQAAHHPRLKKDTAFSIREYRPSMRAITATLECRATITNHRMRAPEITAGSIAANGNPFSGSLALAFVSIGQKKTAFGVISKGLLGLIAQQYTTTFLTGVLT